MYILLACLNITSGYRTAVLLSQRSAALSVRFRTGCFQIDPNVAPNQFKACLLNICFTDLNMHRNTQTDEQRPTDCPSL